MSFGVPTPSTTVTATDDNNIDGLLDGAKWKSNSVSFSFTNSINDYESGYPNRADHADIATAIAVRTHHLVDIFNG
ncbi:hypothetical protein [Coleofasciculus sp. F4-SAH-05]|uniref:hypothetical protein n=1 Tax=Coleofasciculus TaxID=669368 RepID=UPI0032F6E470